MKVLLTTLNTKYIHKNLALRWLYVTKPASFEVDIKEYTINDTMDQIIPKMNIDQYDVIGISVYIWNSELTKQWITEIKKQYPSVRILLGGPEVTYENDDWFDLPIEAIIQGEGEQALWDYLSEREVFCIKKEKGILNSYGRVSLSWLEQFENPYFLSFDLPDISNRYLYIETSRGCPYGCAYCLSERDRHIRTFSKEYLSEIYRHMGKYKIRQVKFLDRTFNLNPDFALWNLKQLEDIRSVQSFQMELVVETLPSKLLNYMIHTMDHHRFRFEAGIQSFHPDTLKAVGRKSNLEKLEEILTQLIQSGIIIHTDLIAGLPYEDITLFEKTFNRLFGLYPSEIQCGTLKLLKGTSLREKAESYGLYADETAPYEVYKTTWLSEENLYTIHDVSFALEKLYNQSRLRYTLIQLIQQENISAFQLFASLGKAMRDLPAPYQLYDLFLIVYHCLNKQIDRDLLEGYLLVDYYRNTRQKPKKLFSEGMNTEIQEWLKKQKIFEDHELEHYAIYTPMSKNHQKYHQLVLYNKQQKICHQYLIDMKNQIVEELI